MLVLLNKIEQNLKVTSHVLEPDPDNPANFSLFHCWKCGSKVMQFSGNEVMSTPGPVFSLLPMIILCKTCKVRHLFTSIL